MGLSYDQSAIGTHQIVVRSNGIQANGASMKSRMCNFKHVGRNPPKLNSWPPPLPRAACVISTFKRRERNSHRAASPSLLPSDVCQAATPSDRRRRRRSAAERRLTECVGGHGNDEVPGSGEFCAVPRSTARNRVEALKSQLESLRKTM